MPQVGFDITANNEGLLSVLQQSADAIKAAASEAVGAFSPLTAAFETLKGTALGVGALFGGGAMFKEAVSTTADLARSSIELGVELGVSATRASDLKVALDMVGVTQEQLAAGANAVTRTLREHEDAFKRLGVQTRDQDGSYRSTIDIMMDVNAALEQMDGTQRNVEGQRIYGRSWQEMQATLRLTPDVMAEAKAAAQSLGIEIGGEQTENWKQYQKSVAGVHAVFLGVKNAIGETLMPSLTALGNWFGSIGPGLVDAFRLAISGLTLAFEIVALPISLVFDTIKYGMRIAVVDVLAGTDAINRALHGDWAGAKAAWREGQDQISQLNKEWEAKMLSDARESKDRMATILAGHVETPIPEQKPTKTKAAPEDDRVPRWQEELAGQQAHDAAMLAEEGQFHEVSKTAEIAYWQDKLDTQNASAKESIAIHRKIYDLQLAVAKEAFQAQLADLKTQEEAAGKDYATKLELAKKYAQEVGQAYGLESKEYAAASKEVIEIKRAEVAQMRELDQIREQSTQNVALAQIDQEEKIAQLNESLHRESEQRLLAQEQQFEDRRFAIRQATLQKELALIDPTTDPVAYAKMNAQIEQLAQQHASTLLNINTKLIQQQQQGWTNLFQTIENDFTTNISKMLEGTETFSQGMRNLFLQIGDAVIQTLVKMAVQWATTQIENRIMGQATAEAQIAASAGEAGAQGVASWAGAPWPLDAGAPAFGAAMAAAAESFSVSERGFDVPANLMPIAQLHPKETVLPADIAERYRSGAPGASAVHFHIDAIDDRSVSSMLREQKGTIAKALRDHTRRRR